jgi:hypothetical protein
MKFLFPNLFVTIFCQNFGDYGGKLVARVFQKEEEKDYF